MEYCICNRVLEQPGSETPVHGVMTICELRPETLINKANYCLTLTLLRLDARLRSQDILMFCIEKCKQLEMLDSSEATILRM